jgi:hypothetical protein
MVFVESDEAHGSRLCLIRFMGHKCARWLSGFATHEFYKTAVGIFHQKNIYCLTNPAFGF